MPQLASSHVADAEYDDESSMLTMTMRDGSVYEYYNVPHFIFENLTVTPDPGGYFRANIKGVYEYLRVS